MITTVSFEVSGRRVLIAGGCGGIGSAFAEAFAQAGATVTVTDLNPPPAELAESFRHHGIATELLDVTDALAIERLADSLDRLDVLIHCAGVLRPFKEHQPAVFQHVVDIHLFAAMRLATALRGKLAPGGCIINIGSVYSFLGNDRLPAYAASKAAIASLTKSLAVAYAPDGIRVNAIAPGFTETDMTASGRQDAQFNGRVMDRLPNRRWAQPVELAGTALFLASPASALINGVTIPVDGGYLAM